MNVRTKNVNLQTNVSLGSDRQEEDVTRRDLCVLSDTYIGSATEEIQASLKKSRNVGCLKEEVPSTNANDIPTRRNLFTARVCREAEENQASLEKLRPVCCFEEGAPSPITTSARRNFCTVQVVPFCPPSRPEESTANCRPLSRRDLLGSDCLVCAGTAVPLCPPSRPGEDTANSLTLSRRDLLGSDCGAGCFEASCRTLTRRDLCLERPVVCAGCSDAALGSLAVAIGTPPPAPALLEKTASAGRTVERAARLLRRPTRPDLCIERTTSASTGPDAAHPPRPARPNLYPRGTQRPALASGTVLLPLLLTVGALVPARPPAPNQMTSSGGGDQGFEDLVNSIDRSRKRHLDEGLLRGDQALDRLRAQEASASPALKKTRASPHTPQEPALVHLPPWH